VIDGAGSVDSVVVRFDEATSAIASAPARTMCAGGNCARP
jgi:hypothetical protein